MYFISVFTCFVEMWHEEWLTIGNKKTYVLCSEVSETCSIKGVIIHSHGMFISSQVESSSEGVVSVLEYCVSAGWRVIRYDLRGQGKSESSDLVENQTWEQLSNELEYLIDKYSTGAEKIILSGLSMGCGISIHYFHKFPSKIHGLLLLLPPTAWNNRIQKVRD